ncbi:molybdopterin-guanine dinucleotide biosynthesis protein B [Pradoshia eiseniae]|uniref:Molybdopterin-guanine dinucleotide biosynthesis protein B n=1 Tax=Pradoshia eiseniae TaxID=2064768 RepID=A0A2S7N0C5_9BACI|nr:molybdopterin-guanine dinucleotide biosynthesis protein B [Pradoshia eiseniae]PQD95435.1 molybdopterin-guanine dinucleotide biosynthesis protein B [Pradoshia eiseniae]
MVTPVWQVVGYQNSGKTVFILSMVSYLKSIGVHTAVLKHHGHGGTPDPAVMKDSDKYFKAGADAALVEGEGVIHLQGRMEENFLSKSLAILMAFETDVILLEGYKKEPYPKIVMIRKEADLSLLEEVTNCQAVILWPGVALRDRIIHLNLPIFSLGDNQRIFEWMVDELGINH